MPEQKPNPALAQKSTPEKGQAPNPPTEPVAKKPVEKKKTPAQKKDEGLKYEMKYVNGGFNNGEFD
jgi:hypothetical protein